VFTFIIIYLWIFKINLIIYKNVQRGREGREKFGSRKGKERASVTNAVNIINKTYILYQILLFKLTINI